MIQSTILFFFLLKNDGTLNLFYFCYWLFPWSYLQVFLFIMNFFPLLELNNIAHEILSLLLIIRTLSAGLSLNNLNEIESW